PEWVTSALALLLLLWLMFALNFLPRWGQYFLFLLNISFHHANPYIIHEPQQMANLMLLLQIFVFPEDAKRNVDPRLTRLLQLWLGVYYLLAGLKKIPMEIWQDGTAVAALIQWSPFLKEGWLTDLILSQADWLSPFLTWTVLGWEILFLPLTLSRYRAVALWLGIFVHTGIWFCMEVGSFSFMMMVWYSLCFPLRDFLFRAPMKR
ncbi:MAG: hypothetical protein N2578_09025, partial [Bdellovibrionaceae bacterium]|nr:hypothetical protein [Pseudobdellovibrionaceae bacterium]